LNDNSWNNFLEELGKMKEAVQKPIAEDSKEKAKILGKKIEELNQRAESLTPHHLLREFWEILNEFHYQISRYQGYQGFKPEIYQDLKKSWEKVAFQIEKFLNEHGKILGVRSWTLKYYPHSLISAFEITFGK